MYLWEEESSKSYYSTMFIGASFLIHFNDYVVFPLRRKHNLFNYPPIIYIQFASIFFLVQILL